MQHLRQHHPTVQVSVEVEKPGREGLQDLAKLADVVFYSRSWAQGNGYSSAGECLRAQAPLMSNATLLLCTWGDSGVSAFQVSTQYFTSCPAFKAKESEVADTVGAGDTFIAGMLFGLLCRADEWTLDGKLVFANELAGRKILQEGFHGLGSLMQHALLRLPTHRGGLDAAK